MFLCCSKFFNDFPVSYRVKAKVKISFRRDSASSGLDWLSDLISSDNIQHCSRKIHWPSCSACQHRTRFCPGALLFASSLSSGACSDGSPFERAPPSPAYLSSNNFHFCFSLHIFFFLGGTHHHLMLTNVAFCHAPK